jgi:hypothetical protein
MDYKIIIEKSAGMLGTDFQVSVDKLAASVREQISLGWEPLGGVSVGESYAMKTPYLFQAMIKRR